MAQYILELGKVALVEHKLQEFRRLGVVDTVDKTTDEILTELCKQQHLNKNSFSILVSEKTNVEGFHMKWHFDDVSVFRNSKKSDKDKFQLYNKSLPPVLSCIVYLSDYNKDFTGGELEFADGTKITPKVGSYVLFDSREAHRVHKIKSGTRKSILFKFYTKLNLGPRKPRLNSFLSLLEMYMKKIP